MGMYRGKVYGVINGRQMYVLCQKGVTMDNDQKEVYFDKYCETCKYLNLDESEYPCYECLNYPSNTNSHKPVYWKEKEK